MRNAFTVALLNGAALIVMPALAGSLGGGLGGSDAEEGGWMLRRPAAFLFGLPGVQNRGVAGLSKHADLSRAGRRLPLPDS